MFLHVLPNAVSPMIVNLALIIPEAQIEALLNTLPAHPAGVKVVVHPRKRGLRNGN